MHIESGDFTNAKFRRPSRLPVGRTLPEGRLPETAQAAFCVRSCVGSRLYLQFQILRHLGWLRLLPMFRLTLRLPEISADQHPSAITC